MEKKAKKKLVTLQLEYLADFFGTLLLKSSKLCKFNYFVDTLPLEAIF